MAYAGTYGTIFIIACAYALLRSTQSRFVVLRNEIATYVVSFDTRNPSLKLPPYYM